MIFCTKCGTPHQEDDNFCKKCGSPLSKASSTSGEKIINIPRSLAKRCLGENLDILRKHQEWCKKTYDYPEIYKYLNWPKQVAWIQFDPTTGRCERILMTRRFDEFDDSIMVDEGLSQIKPGWHYCRIMMPTAEWQIEAYLDSPEDQGELGPTTPSMGGYQARFV
jgi:zinc-ribbon domain